MQNVLTPKQPAKITRQLSSMHLTIGPLVRLFTRNMYHEIENRVSWYEPKIISKETNDELEFWLNNIYIYNGYTFKPRALITCLVFTDASDDGYGGFVLKRLNKEVCSAKFKDCEKQIRSTHRELLSVKYVLDSFRFIRFINNLYGSFTVDRLANNLNRKINVLTQSFIALGHVT